MACETNENVNSNFSKNNIEYCGGNKENEQMESLFSKSTFNLKTDDSNLALLNICKQPQVSLVPVKLEEKQRSPVQSNKSCVEGSHYSARDLITKEMINEEVSLQSEGEKEAYHLKLLAMERWKNISADVKVSQLNHLLEKSSIYANYLLDIMESSKRKQIKKSKKKEKILEKSVGQNDEVKSRLSLNASKSEKRKSVDNNKAKKIKLDAGNRTYKVGDSVMLHLNKYDNEELVKCNIVDTCYENKKWNYKVKFGINNKWVNESAILNDTSYYKDSKLINLKQSSKNIELNSLIQTKLYKGYKSNSNDNRHCINGQKIPDSQPLLLTGGILRDYQITGFQWLKILFDNAVNGILADEMGLGKTIQCIAMVCRLIKAGFKGPFLVCGPLSTIYNWLCEFKKFAPQVPLLLYHGSAQERNALCSYIGKSYSSFGCKPVVVTSYEVLMRDQPKLSKYAWDYLIVDEGHRLKNFNCRLLKELKTFNVTAKILLTGTPLQNSLAELWSLLNFLLPEVFNDLNTFESWFNLGEIQQRAKVISSEQEENVVVMLHKILAPFLLRRTKSDVELELPPKRELIIFVPLSDNQSSFYHAISNRTIRKLLCKKEDENKLISLDSICYENDGLESTNKNATPKKLTRSATLNYRLSKEKEEFLSEDDFVINVSLNNLMMLMRKCCNHPYLIKFPLIPGTDCYRIDHEIISSSGKMLLLDRMLPVLFKNKHKVLLFSQMTKILDILEDYCQFKGFGYFRLDGKTKCDDRQRFIEQYNDDPDIFIFLLSTRAGGLGINLTSADTVIIYDSDWNPQNDLQAQDRCHRIGQMRPVVVYRLVAFNTVDQYMVERAEAKRALERLIINRSKFKGKLQDDLNSNKSSCDESSTLLTVLQKFNGSDGNAAAVVSDEELNKMLDRDFVMSCSEKELECGVFQQIQ